MSSSFATEFNEKARPMLAAIHAETVTVKIKDTPDAPLIGTWRRVLPNIATDVDGLGAQGYTGEATITVNIANLAEPLPAKARIVRNGEEWTVRHTERQDEWTWILHLGRPDKDIRMPQKVK